MTDASYAARRAQGDAHTFPAAPVVSRESACHGLAFVLAAGTPAPDLRPLRDDIAEVRSGLLVGDDTRKLVLVTLVRPVTLPADRLPAGLPLIPAAPGTLRSFADRHGPSDDVALVVDVPWRWVEVWWNGALHRVAIETLDVLPIATLWDMPYATVYRQARHASDEADGDCSEGPTPRPDAAATITRARFVLPADGAGMLSQMSDDLRAEMRGGWLPALFGRMAYGIARPLAAGQRALIAALGLAMMAIAILALGSLGAAASLTGASVFGVGMAIAVMLGLATRVIGDAGGSGGRQAAQPRGPGLLSTMFGWVRWHTALGTTLRLQFGERLNKVEKLIAAGDIDGALRHALRLGAGRPDRKPSLRRFPSALPSARMTLDFDMMSAVSASPILADEAFHALRQRYLQLAEQLERDRDFRRAAYIYSQLLEDHARAVLALERGEIFEEAAKLALGARLDPVLSIRMLYKAGKLDAALALAKRTACFERLAEDSRDTDGAYHAYVVKAWTDMLLATGQPLRALQVTDVLAAADDGGDALFDARRRWGAAALELAQGDGFGSEMVVRALFMASWTAADIDQRGLREFPYMPEIRGTSPYSQALAWLQTVVRGDGADAAENLVELIATIMRVAVPDRREQAAFWRGPACTLIERFALAVLEHASHLLNRSDLQTLERLLQQTELPVLAADLGKLNKLHRASTPPKREWSVPPVDVVRPEIACACVLTNGNMLVWRVDQMLELVDRHGRPLWRRSVSGVVALVAIGSSADVLVLQRHERGEMPLLSRFESHTRKFRPIGSLDLVAHHDLTSDSQWLVQVGSEIGALDLTKLCAPTPLVEFLWSCRLTSRLRVLAFTHHAGGTSWITVDVSDERAGVVEKWTLHASGDLKAQLCLPDVPSRNAEVPEPRAWFWDAQTGHGPIGSIDEPRNWISAPIWSEDFESRARMLARRRRAINTTAVDDFQPCDFERAFVWLDGRAAEAGSATMRLARIAQPSGKASAMTLQHAAGLTLTCVARAPRGLVLLADGVGRLIIVSVTEARVIVT